MSDWEESPDTSAIASRLIAAARSAPPEPPEPAPRRRLVLFGVVALVLVLAGGGLLYLGTRPKHSAPTTDATSAVRQAYLNWWAARKQEYLTLDPGPVKPLMTDAGYQQEAQWLAKQKAAGEAIQLEAQHDLQIVVYRGGVYASLDDIWKSGSVGIDPSTGQQVTAPTGVAFEDSTALKNVSGKWLVDSQVPFGASQQLSGISISYAATGGGIGSPTDGASVRAAFANYERVDNAAYLDLNGGPLPSVESGGALEADMKNLEDHTANNRPIDFNDQDNYRIGFQDSNEAWIYDSVLDTSAVLSGKGGQPASPPTPNLIRVLYGLTRQGNQWTISYTAEVN